MKYIIDKDMLLKLLQDSAELAALDDGGVYSWEWCNASCNDFLEETNCKTFEEVAMKDLMTYIKERKIEEYFVNSSDYDDFENMGK